jgi:hypothetical protein
MSNLLTETKYDIKASGHTPDQIIFIGSEDDGYSCTWQQFKELSNQEYDSGFGAAEVAIDLVIVFDDGSKMWREEYDGSENWSYSSPFVMPEKKLPIKRLIGDYWPSIKSLQDDADTHHNPSIEKTSNDL